MHFIPIYSNLEVKIMLPGVYLNKKKDGTPLYRASITHGGKHISLGSFPDEQTAHRAYLEASSLFSTKQPALMLLELRFIWNTVPLLIIIAKPAVTNLTLMTCSTTPTTKL